MLDDQFWRFYMGIYDLGVGTLHPYHELADEIAALAAREERYHVIELGCGTGNMLARLQGVCPTSALLGVDGSREALDVARGKFKGNEAVFIREDLNGDWPSVIASRYHPVDVVVCVNVLYALADPLKFLREVTTLLKPGGVLILSNPWKKTPDHIIAAHQAWIATCKPQAIAQDKKIAWAREVILVMNQHIAKFAADRTLHFLERDELVALVRQAGLEPYYVNPTAYAGGNVTIGARRKA